MWSRPRWCLKLEKRINKKNKIIYSNDEDLKNPLGERKIMDSWHNLQQKYKGAIPVLQNMHSCMGQPFRDMMYLCVEKCYPLQSMSPTCLVSRIQDPMRLCGRWRFQGQTVILEKIKLLWNFCTAGWTHGANCTCLCSRVNRIMMEFICAPDTYRSNHIPGSSIQR